MSVEAALTLGERRRLSVVEAHLSAISAITRDITSITKIDALLANDFTWLTPSTDPMHGMTRDRATYLAILSRPDLMPENERFVALEIKLLASTVDGLRIAGETISNGLRRDGLRYSNRYHQLWRFDADDKIVEYRIYADTRNVDAVHAAGVKQVAMAFLKCLASGDASNASGLLADSFRWVIREGARSETILNQTAALERIGAEASLGLELISESAIACGNRVVAEATDLAAGWRQFFCLLEHGKIVEVRDYRCAGGKL